MVAWPVDALRACEAVHAIVIAAPPGHEEVLAGEGLTVVTGGSTRSHSVENALREVTTDLVAIHDAARPLLTPGLAEALIAALVADPEASGAIAAAPITDTVKRAGAGLAVEATLDRTELWGAQTPQVFWAKALRGALAVDDVDRDAATDEAMLVEQAGGKVLIHPSGPENLKVTTPHDLRVAEVLLAERLGGSGRA
jgi:2-C-methyl-D-erythritol 4-phosphate cytidylyltransferase